MPKPRTTAASPGRACSCVPGGPVPTAARPAPTQLPLFAEAAALAALLRAKRRRGYQDRTV